jgi:hypothetical protein
MIFFKDKSDKAVFDKYYDLYSKWFNRERPVNPEINTKNLVKLIEAEYRSMSEERIKIELISLRERIEINKIRKTYTIEYCFYNLCMDVLNQYIDSKFRKKTSIDDGFIVDLSDWIFGGL